MKKIILAPTFILHKRAYRENSFLIEVFTKDDGRFTVIAKGVKKNIRLRSLLQPFNYLLISSLGRFDLLALSHVESFGAPITLTGEFLFAGFYLNELLMRLLQKWDANALLFNKYEQTLLALAAKLPMEPVLRSFEKHLLEELGYAVWPKTESMIQAAFHPEQFYHFHPDTGWQRVCENSTGSFQGSNLIAMANENWQNEICLREAKRLIRLILLPLLGQKPIYSRQLFK